MFKKILIANRGEIAVRIIRACREMGILTVAVFSEADRDSLHTQLADEAVCIGPAHSKDSYLNIANIISATVLTGAEAIHPGVGFLSENSRFAQVCEECNIKFIGPSVHSIDLMGNKSRAREVMQDANIPVVPGSEGIIVDEAHAVNIAKEIGYPVMIKASNGGGGRGIRVAYNEEELLRAYSTTKSEALSCFGSADIYMERFIKNPHHIEFQIIADSYGNVVHLNERDCSVQRRNQKVIEEAPSVLLSEETRKSMGEVAVRAAKAVKYENAGTIEFLVDDNLDFYFMEMNTRIQVEHPITEMITGVDLIREQIKIAYGEKLSFTQEDISIDGHSIECRINAENPSKGFRPSPGTVTEFMVPGGLGVRLDSSIYRGYTISPFYDSMIGKLIVHAKTRQDAILKMKRALAEFIIDGVENNIEFQFDILNDKDFIEGKYNTGFLENKLVK